jgi:hypothetical protein
VIWLGVALGTFIAVVAFTHGARLRIGFPGFLGSAVGALAILVICEGTGIGAAALVRRYHKPALRSARRQSGRGARAGASRYAQWAGARPGRLARWTGWLARWLVGRLTPQVPARPGPQQQPVLSTQSAGGSSPRPPGNNNTLAPTGGNTIMSARHAAGRGTAGNGNGNGPAGRPHWSVRHSNGQVPQGWAVVAARYADFQPMSDEELLAFEAQEFMGMVRLAAAQVALHEYLLKGTRLHPASVEAVHEVSDALSLAAQIMDKAFAKFVEHYELPNAYVANGGLLPKDGDFLTGNQ